MAAVDLVLWTAGYLLTLRQVPRRGVPPADGTPREPFNYTPMGVNSILSSSPHVRPTGRTCGEPNEIKKNTHPKNTTLFFVGR